MDLEKNNLVVRSWPELCERLYDFSWQDDIGRFRSNYAFRGISDQSYELSTRFRRNCGPHPKLEYHLLRNFRKYAQYDCGNINFSDWHWLTLAQHYGLPTRLLDWTYSPFVALHFVTFDTEKYDRDGVIWHVDYVKINRLLPPPLIDVLNEAGANAFTVELLEKAVPDLNGYDCLDPGKLVLFFEPPSIDARIINQFAFFSVMSSAATNMDTWLLKHPELFRRIIIPKELKWEIRDKLDQANITERMLFPGLDGLASWLARHYRPRAPSSQG